VRRKKFVCKRETVFTYKFWASNGELSVGKSTSHGLLESNHCLVVFYVEEEAWVPINQVASM
jgi:hypothetical protein